MTWSATDAREGKTSITSSLIPYCTNSFSPCVFEDSAEICERDFSKLIPDILQTFRKRCPGTRFSISQSPAPSDNDYRFDFTIDASLSPATGPDSCTLLQEDILLALPVEHRLASGEDVELAELKEEPFISLQKGMGLSDIVNYYCRLSGFVPDIVFESDSPATMRNLIHLGLGIAFIPKQTWPDLEDHSIRLLPIHNVSCKRCINLHWSTRRHLTQTALEFKDYLIDYFSGLA